MGLIWTALSEAALKNLRQFQNLLYRWHSPKPEWPAAAHRRYCDLGCDPIGSDFDRQLFLKPLKVQPTTRPWKPQSQSLKTRHKIIA